MDLKGDELLVELDGENVGPGTVDPRSLLSLSAAYLELLVRIAEEKEADLVLTGLAVVDKCAATSTRVDDPSLAWSAASEADSYLGPEEVPHGLRKYVQAVLDSIRSLPYGVTAAVRMGERSLRLIDRSAPRATRPWARTTLWVRPIRIGGRRERIVLESGSEQGTFSLSLSLDRARELGPYLKKDVLAEVEIVRDAEGRIEDGRLHSWLAPDVQPGQELEAWRKWFQSSVDSPAVSENGDTENE